MEYSTVFIAFWTPTPLSFDRKPLVRNDAIFGPFGSKTYVACITFRLRICVPTAEPPAVNWPLRNQDALDLHLATRRLAPTRFAGSPPPRPQHLTTPRAARRLALDCAPRRLGPHDKLRTPSAPRPRSGRPALDSIPHARRRYAAGRVAAPRKALRPTLGTASRSIGRPQDTCPAEEDVSLRSTLVPPTRAPARPTSPESRRCPVAARARMSVSTELMTWRSAAYDQQQSRARVGPTSEAAQMWGGRRGAPRGVIAHGGPTVAPRGPTCARALRELRGRLARPRRKALRPELRRARDYLHVDRTPARKICAPRRTRAAPARSGTDHRETRTPDESGGWAPTPRARTSPSAEWMTWRAPQATRRPRVGPMSDAVWMRRRARCGGAERAGVDSVAVASHRRLVLAHCGSGVHTVRCPPAPTPERAAAHASRPTRPCAEESPASRAAGRSGQPPRLAFDWTPARKKRAPRACCGVRPWADSPIRALGDHASRSVGCGPGDELRAARSTAGSEVQKEGGGSLHRARPAHGVLAAWTATRRVDGGMCERLVIAAPPDSRHCGNGHGASDPGGRARTSRRG
ncbi:hypothetical protein B0H10DRAFT_2444548 [Mycena sp. CBHHK59/15]|nr:hypothetical protein B0H10DRAFT_2444548 [Mycena sp. CBHHK59/15]